MHRGSYECYMQEAFYHQQQEALNEIGAKLCVVVFRPDYHRKERDKNTVLFYTKDDEAYNRELDKQGWVAFERYKKPFFWFENTDRNGNGTYEFANFGKIDLRPLRWREALEGAISLAYYKYIQKEYVICSGGYLSIGEADGIYNDLNRSIIEAFTMFHGMAFLGNINFYDEKYQLVVSGERSVYDEYEGQKVYNFDYAFIVPEPDEELEDMIRSWNKSNRKIGKATKIIRVDSILSKVEKIGGINFVWF